MNEVDAAAKHLFDTLVADAGVGALIGDRIYHAVAPEEAAYPFVIYSQHTGRDRLAAGGQGRMLVRSRWLILAVHNENDMARVRKLASTVDAALVGSAATVEIDAQSYHVQSVSRREPVERVGERDGTIYVNAGGYYATSAYSVP